jgi:hypothetical protein
MSLWAAILGDVGLQVVDDTVKGRVYLQVIHPATIKAVELDSRGNVKGYTIEEQRDNPITGSGTVTYTEIAKRDGEDVVYTTKLNGQPYAWNGAEAEWSNRYGFVPMVMLQHNNVGLDFGWSEIHPGRWKFQEADDLASKLSDQVRKMVDAPWLFSGMSKPAAQPRTGGNTPTITEPSPGREELPVLYAPAGTVASPLVAPLSIGETSQYIQSLLQELERDYPELQMDIWTAGATSGRALRVARQRVTTKVQERRALSDDVLVRAQKMAVAIGGFRGYKGFTGFSLESYEAGALDHAIDDRPVFAKDPMDDIEVESALWSAAKTAKEAGFPLVNFLERNGFSKDNIKSLEASPEWGAYMKQLEMTTAMGGNLTPNAGDGGQPVDTQPAADANAQPGTPPANAGQNGA